MSGPHDDEVDIVLVTPEQFAHLVRINPEAASLAAALTLRFWERFDDQQIADVLGSTPDILKMENTQMTLPTTDAPQTLDATEFVYRAFIGANPTDPTMVIATVTTEESEDDFLGLEANFRLGDGEGYAEIDLSTLMPLQSPDDRADAYNQIAANIAKMRALAEAVAEFSDAFIDASLEALTVVKSYGDDLQDVEG